LQVEDVRGLNALQSASGRSLGPVQQTRRQFARAQRRERAGTDREAQSFGLDVPSNAGAGSLLGTPERARLRS